MDYRYQDVIPDEFHCQGHKNHHKVKTGKRGKTLNKKNESFYLNLGKLTNLDLIFLDRMVQLREMNN